DRTRPYDKVPIPRLHDVVTYLNLRPPHSATKDEAQDRFEPVRPIFDPQRGHHFKRPGRAQNRYIRPYFRLRPVVWVGLVVRSIEDHERARPEDPAAPVQLVQVERVIGDWTADLFEKTVFQTVSGAVVRVVH